MKQPTIFRSYWRNLGLCLCLSILVPACAASRDSSLHQDSQSLLKATNAGDFHNALEAAQQHWEQRIERSELEAAIEQWELATTFETPHLSDDERKAQMAEIFEQLARAYYFLADGHIAAQGNDPAENRDEMMAVYEKGITAAEKAIALRDAEFTNRVLNNESWQKVVVEANPEAIPGLYWYATNLGKWALLEGIATILARKDDIKATMDFIVEHNPAYFHGAAYRYFGVYWTALPFGKKPIESEQAFLNSLEVSPNYFATRVLIAEKLATLNNDRALFEEHLRYVIDTPSDIDPAIAPENYYEQIKAQRLLERGDRLFR